MKLHKEIKPRVIVPIKGDNGFYKCVCGNILTGYLCQTCCEACNAELDWDGVLASYEGRERKEKNGNKK